uniref:protein FAM133-like n=1 Tax=Myxine glutinosa TaxID=7769 RepID=UPI00358F9742
MRLESEEKERLVKEAQKDHFRALDKLKEKMRLESEEAIKKQRAELEQEKETKTKREEAWQKEKVHGTQGKPESGILEKREQIDAESGCDKEDGTAKEEAYGEDEELSSYQMTQEIQPSTDIVKCLQGNLMQSLEEEMNRSGSDGHVGEVEIGAHAKSKAVTDCDNRSDGESRPRLKVNKNRAFCRKKNKMSEVHGSSDKRQNYKVKKKKKRCKVHGSSYKRQNYKVKKKGSKVHGSSAKNQPNYKVRKKKKKKSSKVHGSSAKNQPNYKVRKKK